MFRQKIFIGEADDRTVYYDVKTKEALIADKNILLNTSGAAKTNAYIPLLIFLGTAGGSIAAFFGLTDARYGYYSPSMVPFFIVGWLVIGFGFVWMMELALYQHVAKTEPATKEQFHQAVYTNQFLSKYEDKRVTSVNYMMFALVFIAMLPCTYIIFWAGFPNVINSFYNREPFDIQIFFSLGITLFPAILYLLIFQNNPFRWLNTVRKYERGEIIFKEDIVSNVSSPDEV